MFKINKVNTRFHTFSGLMLLGSLNQFHPIFDKFPGLRVMDSLEVAGEYMYNAYGGVDIMFANAMLEYNVYTLSPHECEELAMYVESALEVLENNK